MGIWNINPKDEIRKVRVKIPKIVTDKLYNNLLNNLSIFIPRF